MNFMQITVGMVENFEPITREHLAAITGWPRRDVYRRVSYVTRQGHVRSVNILGVRYVVLERRRRVPEPHPLTVSRAPAHAVSAVFARDGGRHAV